MFISDLELDAEGDPKGSNSQAVRKNISIKLKASPKGRGKGRRGSAKKKPAKKVVEQEDPMEPGIYNGCKKAFKKLIVILGLGISTIFSLKRAKAPPQSRLKAPIYQGLVTPLATVFRQSYT